MRVTQDKGGGVVLEERAVVARVDPAARVLFWVTPLGVVDPTKELRIESEVFAVSIRERGRLREVFEDLTLVPGHAPGACASQCAPPPDANLRGQDPS